MMNSELLFISIWQGFSQYFAKKLIKIMLKIDFEIDLKLSQANIAKILVNLRSTHMCFSQNRFFPNILVNF